MHGALCFGCCWVARTGEDAGVSRMLSDACRALSEGCRVLSDAVGAVSGAAVRYVVSGKLLKVGSRKPV